MFWDISAKFLGCLSRLAELARGERFSGLEIPVGVGFMEPSAQLDENSPISNAVSSSTLVPVFHWGNGDGAVAGVRRGMERAALWQSASDSGR